MSSSHNASSDNTNADIIQHRIATIQGFEQTLHSDNSYKLSDALDILKQMGIRVEWGTGRNSKHITLSDDRTNINFNIGLQQSDNSGILAEGEKTKLRTFLKQVTSSLETQVKNLDTQSKKLASSKLSEIERGISDKLGSDTLDQIDMNLSFNREGEVAANFSYPEQPYIKWSVTIPTNVAGLNGHVDSSALSGFLPTFAAMFDLEKNSAEEVEAKLNWLKANNSDITYLEHEGKLKISHPLLDGPMYLQDTSVSTLNHDLESVTLKLLEQTEQQTAKLKNQLKDACDRRKLDCSFESKSESGLDVVTAHIRSTNLGTETTPLFFEITHDINPLQTQNTLNFINSGLGDSYRAFNRSIDEKLLANLNTKAEVRQPVELPNIQAQPGQSVLYLSDSTDMAKIRNGLMNLKHIDFDSEAEQLLDRALSEHLIDHTTVRSLLLSAVMAVSGDSQEFRSMVQNIQNDTPLYDEIDGKKSGIKTTLNTLLSTAAPADKHGGTARHGNTHYRTVYPDDVSRLLHVLDAFAEQKAKQEGLEKLPVAIHGSITRPKLREKHFVLGASSKGANALLSRSNEEWRPLPRERAQRVSSVDIAIPTVAAALISGSNKELLAAGHTKPQNEPIPQTIIPHKAEPSVAYAEPSTPTPVLEGDNMSRPAITNEEIALLTIPHQERFGTHHRRLRKERGLTKQELAEEIRTSSNTPTLETPVTVEEINSWERGRSVPEKEVIKILVQILIDENPNIPQNDKENIKSEFYTALVKTSRALDNLRNNRAGMDDFEDVQLFKAEFETLRNGYLDNEALVNALNSHGQGHDIKEPIDDINGELIYKIESGGHVPSEGLHKTVIDIFHQGKPFSETERSTFSERFAKALEADSFVKRLTSNNAQVAAGSHSPSLKRSQIRSEIRQLFTDNDGNVLKLNDIASRMRELGMTTTTPQAIGAIMGEIDDTIVMRRTTFDERLNGLQTILEQLGHGDDKDKLSTLMMSLEEQKLLDRKPRAK